MHRLYLADPVDLDLQRLRIYLVYLGNPGDLGYPEHLARQVLGYLVDLEHPGYLVDPEYPDPQMHQIYLADPGCPGPQMNL